jgi:tRNA A37 N6-isopentenylltransferase MiaA
MHPVIAIVGPTASGKSDLALFLAESFSGEIVNYDSVQIFRHLDIGTAKPSAAQLGRVLHHMIDIREPTETYTAGDYQRDARRILTRCSTYPLRNLRSPQIAHFGRWHRFVLACINRRIVQWT